MDRAVLLAADANGRQIVSIHAKLTYKLLPSGACELAEDQTAFLNLEHDPAKPDTEDDARFFPESDIIPFKAATDLIVMASAHAPGGRPTARMTAGIECGPLRRDFLVQGDRRCIYRGRGQVAFSEPEPFETMPLRYERAYGGCDPHVVPPVPKGLLDALTPHPGIYPRNPAGRGYVVCETPELIDGLLLPNVEDPGDPLRPERLVSGGPENWWRQPLPWSCDWFDVNWYPRSVFLGGLPDHLPDDDRLVEEVRRGYVPGDQNARFRQAAISDLFDPRLGDAASPGLAVPFMKGDEAVCLRGMTRLPEFVVRLPGQPPKMDVRFERKTVSIVPVPNRVLISTEEMGVYIVWHGAFATPRELPDRPQPGLDAPPGWELDGVEVLVDGKPVVPLA
jgi:hypothetical protein